MTGRRSPERDSRDRGRVFASAEAAGSRALSRVSAVGAPPESPVPRPISYAAVTGLSYVVIPLAHASYLLTDPHLIFDDVLPPLRSQYLRPRPVTRATSRSPRARPKA